MMGSFFSNKLLSISLLTTAVLFNTACSKNWKTESESQNGSFAVTTTTNPAATTTTSTTWYTTTTMAPPTTVMSTTSTTVPGYGITIPVGSPLAGYYPNLSALATTATNAHFYSCITVNGCKIYNGAGPCYQVSAPYYNVSQDPVCQAPVTTTTWAPPTTTIPSPTTTIPAPTTTVPPPTTTTVPPPTTTTVPLPTTTTVAAGGDLCAAFPDVQYMDVGLTFNRSIIGTYFGNDTVVVARFTIPANYTDNNSYIDATVAEWQGPPTYRWSTISDRPCDFRATDVTGLNGPVSASGGTLTQNLVDIGAGKPHPRLIPGQTYYLNVRNAWVNELGQVVGSCQEDTNCKASIVIVDRHY